MKDITEGNELINGLENENIDIKVIPTVIDEYLFPDMKVLYVPEEYINDKSIKFLKQDESFKIKEIEVGQHGHHGSNGAKGNFNSFRKSYNKIILAHTHSPKIINGIYYVGTLSKLQLSYNKGCSSWLHANCLIYSNSSRQLIVWVGDKWKI